MINEDIKAIIRELLKYEEDIFELLISSDYEDDKEYNFDAGIALDTLKKFAN